MRPQAVKASRLIGNHRGGREGPPDSSATTVTDGLSDTNKVRTKSVRNVTHFFTIPRPTGLTCAETDSRYRTCVHRRPLRLSEREVLDT